MAFTVTDGPIDSLSDLEESIDESRGGFGDSWSEEELEEVAAESEAFQYRYPRLTRSFIDLEAEDENGTSKKKKKKK